MNDNCPLKSCWPLILDSISRLPNQFSANEQLKKRISQLCPDIRPDIANNLLYSRYDKAIIDALNGLAFKDNSQIIASQTQFIYSDNPHTEIELTEITEI